MNTFANWYCRRMAVGTLFMAHYCEMQNIHALRWQRERYKHWWHH